MLKSDYITVQAIFEDVWSEYPMSTILIFSQVNYCLMISGWKQNIHFSM